MRRTAIVAMTLGFVLTLGTVASADEIIRFKNGTYLTINSHTVTSEMVTVILGTNARMAFPLAVVEAIERGGVSIFRPGVGTNVVGVSGGVGVAGAVSLNDAPPSHASYRVYGSAPPRPTRTSKSARRQAMMAGDATDLLYLDSGAPESASMFEGHPDANHRKFTVTGNSSVVGSFNGPDDPTTIEPPPQSAPRGRATSIQQRAVPLPTHPREQQAIRDAEGDRPPQQEQGSSN